MCVCVCVCVITTGGDVHGLEGDIVVAVVTVEILGVQPRLPSLLPQLKPAHVTTTVKHHALQTSEIGRASCRERV